MDGANQEPTCWKPTATPGLYVRQPGGGFYARVALDGKRTWWSLKTTKLRKGADLLRDLQAGFTRRVSTRSNSPRHAAIGAVMLTIRQTSVPRRWGKNVSLFRKPDEALAAKLPMDSSGVFLYLDSRQPIACAGGLERSFPGFRQ